eukprot:3205224-Pyramimonas_sp.AAC.1
MTKDERALKEEEKKGPTERRVRRRKPNYLAALPLENSIVELSPQRFVGVPCRGPGSGSRGWLCCGACARARLAPAPGICPLLSRGWSCRERARGVLWRVARSGSVPRGVARADDRQYIES